MKYIIPNSKLYNTIYKTIDEFMFKTEIQWEFGENPYTMEKTEYEVRFFGLDYINGDDDEPLFMYVKKEWYTEIEKNQELKDKYIKMTPMLEVPFHTKFVKMMNNRVENLWRPVFEDWWKNSFIAFPVKTFIYFPVK